MTTTVTISDGVTITVPSNLSVSMSSGGGPTPPIPPVTTTPNPQPPLPPGAGYARVDPPTSGQGKYNYNIPMVLDLIAQPVAKNANTLGFIKTAPQIGGDTDAGPALIEWTGFDGLAYSRPYDAPVTVWYSTSPSNPNSYLQPQPRPGSTIRVSVLNPTKPWFLDYRTPTVG